MLTSTSLLGFPAIMPFCLSSQWVMDFLAEEKSISTVKGELIPMLVNSQGLVHYDVRGFHHVQEKKRGHQQLRAGVLRMIRRIRSQTQKDETDTIIKDMSHATSRQYGACNALLPLTLSASARPRRSTGALGSSSRAPRPSSAPGQTPSTYTGN
jgi:hypothetical protein